MAVLRGRFWPQLLYSGKCASRPPEVDSQGLILCGQVPGEAAIHGVNYMGRWAAVQILSPRRPAARCLIPDPAGSERD